MSIRFVGGVHWHVTVHLTCHLHANKIKERQSCLFYSTSPSPADDSSGRLIISQNQKVSQATNVVDGERTLWTPGVIKCSEKNKSSTEQTWTNTNRTVGSIKAEVERLSDHYRDMNGVNLSGEHSQLLSEVRTTVPSVHHAKHKQDGVIIYPIFSTSAVSVVFISVFPHSFVYRKSVLMAHQGPKESHYLIF